MITLSIILTLVITASFFIIRNLVQKNEQLEDFISKQSDAINACDQRLKQLDEKTRRTGKTQIFIETPYRNNQIIETLLDTCNKNTKLCIASNITMSSENIKTKTIAEWKQAKIQLHKKPTIFLIG